MDEPRKNHFKTYFPYTSLSETKIWILTKNLQWLSQQKNCITITVLALFLFSSSSYSAFRMGKKQKYKPCKQLILYFHDIIYNGRNTENATSAIVAVPEGANLTILAPQFHFGKHSCFRRSHYFGQQSSLESSRSSSRDVHLWHEKHFHDMACLLLFSKLHDI